MSKSPEPLATVDRLDEETERLISEAVYHEATLQGTLSRNARTAKSWIKAREAIRDSTLAALRARIRQLVDEARLPKWEAQ